MIHRQQYGSDLLPRLCASWLAYRDDDLALGFQVFSDSISDRGFTSTFNAFESNVSGSRESRRVTHGSSLTGSLHMGPGTRGMSFLLRWALGTLLSEAVGCVLQRDVLETLGLAKRDVRRAVGHVEAEATVLDDDL